jgi:uncharacterized membrane protein YidH (DUF202 family)
MALDPEPLPSGLAEERTELAWNRTGLAVLVCLAVLLRRIWPLDRTGVEVGLACCAAGAVIWIAALWSGRRASSAPGTDQATIGPRSVALIAWGTVAFAVAGFVLTLATVH